MKFVFIFLITLITLMAKPIIVKSDMDAFNIVPYVNIYKDTHHQYTIETILKNPPSFTKSRSKLLYYHFDDAAFWFEFTLLNPTTTAKEYMLSVPTAWLDSVVLYSIKPDGNYTIQQSGDRVKAADKSIKNRSIAFHLNVSQGSNHFYIKIESQDALQLPMFIYSLENFYTSEDIQNLFFAFVTGTIFMMLLYAFFYFVYLKDYLYGIYIGYLVTFIVMVLSTHGYFLHYLWVDHFDFNEWIYSIGFIGYLFFMLWFAKEFLQTKVTSPLSNTLLKIAIVIHLTVLLLSPILPYPLIMQFGVISGAITPFVILIPALLSYKKNSFLTKFYLIGWSINILFYAVWALSFFAILPYTILLNNANSIGVLIELLILSLGMVYRVDTIVKFNAKLSSDVKTDALTNVANRYAFNTDFPLYVQQAQQHNRSLYFAMLDIDNFKLYNDSYGHPKGDEALKEVAKILKDKLSRSCDKVYRLGGEEFGLVICEHSMQQAIASVEKIRQAIESHGIEFDQSDTKVLTASFGLIGIRNTKESDYTAIYKAADELLYNAKNSGRNKIIHKQL